MSYRNEFPDFDPATMPAIPEGFVDFSWHNDTMPHFGDLGRGIDIWIDFADADLRETGMIETPRFQIYKTDIHGQWTSDFPVLATDNWEEILRHIEQVKS